MIYAMSDIHGCYDLMKERVDQIRPCLQENKNDKLILLGDYIDRSKDSFNCLKLAFDLEKEFGREQVIVLKGNHEVLFEEFLFENEDVWINEDSSFMVSGTFLCDEELEELRKLSSRQDILVYIRNHILNSQKELLNWMKKLRLYYETETQIFVHAGVDEDIPEEEQEWCTLGTAEYIMTGKYPPTTGKFYKDIIAGHVAAATVAGDRDFKGIYYDGLSHYYIDGSAEKGNDLLCLVYDEKKKQYYEWMPDGEKRILKKEIWQKSLTE